MTPAILAKDLNFDLGGKMILKNLSFSFDAGQCIGLVGHNGAGKTTLFHLVFGIKFATSGKLQILGNDVGTIECRRRLSFVPERPYLNPADTAHEMLKFYGNLAGVSDLETRITQVIQQVGLESIGGKDVAQRKLKTFSKGMLQRSLIAQALLSSPDFLILDEPMSGLDPEGRAWVKGLIADLKKQGNTVLFSSHALEDVAELADQVLVMSQGKIDYAGPQAGWKA